MPEKATPEEKLLKLIENPSSDNKAVILGANKGFSFSLAAIIDNIANTWPGKEKLSVYVFNLRFLNYALIAAAFVLAGYLTFNLMNVRFNVNKIYVGSDRSAKLNLRNRPGELEGKVLSLSDYLNQIERRDIFHFVPVKKEEKIPAAKEALTTLTNNLKLVGIIWSQNPQAMIEDKKENKTLLVSPGESIGNLKVKQILNDRVVLVYEDQEMELM